MKKILNATMIRCGLKHSFAVALVAKAFSLPTVSAKKIVFTFEPNQVITKEVLWKKLEEKKEKYIENCNNFAKTLNEKATSTELCDIKDNYSMPFSHLIVGDIWDHIDYKSIQGATKEHKPKLEAVRFLTTLNILKDRILKNQKTDDDALREAHEALCKSAQFFFDEKLKHFLEHRDEQGFLDPRYEQDLQVKIEELKKSVDPTFEFVFQNGIVTEKDSKHLFENSRTPLRLTFDNVRGVFRASEALKQKVVSLTFFKSKLRFVESCFEGAPLLEGLIVKEDAIFKFGKRSFANCEKLEYAFQGNGRICLDKEDTDTLLGAFADCRHLKKEQVQKIALDFFIAKARTVEWPDEDKAREFLQDNQLTEVHMYAIDKFKLEKEMAELEKELSDWKARATSFRNKFERLKKYNRNKEEAKAKYIQDCKDAQRAYKEEKKAREELLQDKSQLESECKRFKKTVEEITKELESIRKERDNTNKKLSEVREDNKKLKETLGKLETENKAQKDGINTLKEWREEWESKINTVKKLEAENSCLKVQLAAVTLKDDDARRMLNRERAENGIIIKNLKSELKEVRTELDKSKKLLSETQKLLSETQKLLSETQVKLKDLKTSQALMLGTMDFLEDEEDKKGKIDSLFPLGFKNKQNDKQNFFSKIKREALIFGTTGFTADEEEKKEKIDCTFPLTIKKDQKNEKNPFPKKTGKKGKKGKYEYFDLHERIKEENMKKNVQKHDA